MRPSLLAAAKSCRTGQGTAPIFWLLLAAVACVPLTGKAAAYYAGKVAECKAAMRSASACSDHCKVGPRCRLGPEWGQCLNEIQAEVGACVNRCFARSTLLCSNEYVYGTSSYPTPAQIAAKQAAADKFAHVRPQTDVAKTVSHSKGSEEASKLLKAPTRNKGKALAAAGSAMRPATTGAIVEGSGSGSPAARPGVTGAIAQGSGSGSPPGGQGNSVSGSGTGVQCSEPGAGGSVSVPCSILGIFPPTGPQYFIVPALNNSRSIASPSQSVATPYNANSADRLLNSADQLLSTAIEGILEPPLANIPPLSDDVTQLPSSYIPEPSFGPGSPGWEGGNIVPGYPEGMHGAPGAAAVAIEHVAGAIANNDPASAQSTVGSETIKQLGVDPVATNIGIDAGVLALSVPYVGSAIAPGVAVGAKWLANQVGGAVVDSMSDTSPDPFGLLPTTSPGGTDALQSNVPSVLLP